MGKKEDIEAARAAREAAVMSGFPKDGDEYHEEEGAEGGEEEGEGEGEGEKGSEHEEEDLKLVVARLQGELNVLKSSRNASPEPEKKKEGPVERDWEQLIFEDTKNAIKLLRQDIRAEITSELRGEYQRDTSDRQFWSDFYAANEDLKTDDDLVKATLGKNMASLANLPVSEASKKLADLTRERILRYKGGEVDKKNLKKAKTEGAAAPGGRKPAPEAPKILSLGDVIRARRAARSKKAVTA